MRKACRRILPALCLGLGVASCVPQPEARVPEDRTPYFLEGRAKAERRDYRAAIEAFEKDVERNPRSALAHFELGILYDQHGDQSEGDLVSAMYHYQQVIRLRAPSIYPYDNARKRFMDCKMQLVKMESLTPVYQQVVRDLERLREENMLLRKQLENAGVQPAPVRPAVPVPVAPPSLSALSPSAQSPRSPTSSVPARAVPRVSCGLTPC